MDFLDSEILDNNTGQLIRVLCIIIFVLLFRKLLSSYIASLLYLPVKKHWKTVEKKQFKGLIIKPLGWFLVVLIAVFAIDKLNFPEEWKFSIYGISTETILARLGKTLISIFFIWVVVRLIDFIALIFEMKAKETKDKRDDQLITFFRDFFKAIVYLFCVLLILKVGFNQRIGSLLTGLSIVGAALALAAKESIENLIASFIIFFDKPFFTGDTVKVNAVAGTIEHIGLRSTRIRTADKTLVTVPNKQMVDSVVDNWSMRTNRRAEIKLEFEAEIKLESLQSLVNETSRYLGNTEKFYKSSAFITDFSKSGITLTIEYFTPPFSMNEFNSLKQEVNLWLKNEMDARNIRLAAGNDISIINTVQQDPNAGKMII